MIIGLSTASLFSRELTENCFRIVNSLKIPLCEVFLSTYREYEPSFIDILLDRIGDTKVYSVHTLTQQYEPELFNLMQRTREDNEAIFVKCADAAGKLGASYYIFHGPAKFKKLPYVHDYPKLGARLEELRALMKKYSFGKTDMAYENVHWAFFNNPEYFDNLKKYTGIKTCLDIKQARLSGYSSEEYIKCMGKRLTNVHLCDYNNQGFPTLPGKGMVDFVKLFRTLKEYGYDGPLMIEVYADNYVDYDELARCYDYLNECLFQANDNTH